MKVCVIDEWLDNDLLDKITNSAVKIDCIGSGDASLNFPAISHGTICTGLLVEALRENGVFGDVQLVHYSISTESELRSYFKMLEALEFCSTNHIDIVSMSIGVFQRHLANEMTEFICKIPLIVAAASNDFSITYPAALPNVLGVKYARGNIRSPYVILSSSLDGIEIEARLPETPVIEMLRDKYGIRTQESNSSIPPRICAKLVSEALKSKKQLTKELALELLANEDEVCREDFSLLCARDKAEDEKSPIIFLPTYDHGGMQMVSQVYDLQEHFETHGYPCGVISNLFDYSDFQLGRYRLEPARIKECISYYQKVTAESLFLLLAPETLISREAADLCIPGWCSKHKSDICDMILQEFPEEVS